MKIKKLIETWVLRTVLLFVSSVLLTLILFFSSCNDETSRDNILLSESDITMWIEQSYSVEVLSKLASISIKSDDEEIASASIINNILTIKAHGKSGETIIHLLDKTGNEGSVKVSVHTLFGSWMAVENSKYKIEVIIDADIVDEEISNNLWASTVRSLNTTYGFYLGSNHFTIIEPRSETKEGTYEFGQGKLILRYDNKIMSYEVTFLAHRFLMLTQDFTDYYQNLFPEYGVKKVSVNSYISFISL